MNKKIEGLQVLGPIPAPFSKKRAVSLAVAITARFSETITGGIKSIFARADKVFSSAVDFRRGSIGFELAKNSLEKCTVFSRIRRFYTLSLIYRIF